MAMIPEPTKMAAYTIYEVSRYISVPYSTLYHWSIGRGAKGCFVNIPSRRPNLMSFINLTELHLLRTIRSKYKISAQKIYNAIRYLKKYAESEQEKEYPLACAKMLVDIDRRSIFVKQSGILIDASGHGQTTMHELIGLALDRIEKDNAGIPIKLYPFTTPEAEKNSPKKIVIDPRISFGRPIISEFGISTSIIAGRHKYGESIDSLCEDYGCSREDIEEAIRFEFSSPISD